MKKIFGIKEPVVKPPAPAPDPEDSNIGAELRRRAARAARSSGARSTELTRPGSKETLGQ